MTKQCNRLIALFCFVALSVSPPLAAVETSFWEVSTYESFLQGTLDNISLSRDPRLRLSPESKSIFDPDETLVLSLVRDDEGWLYFGTGHQGKVFRIDEEGEGELLFTAPEPDIFALAVGPEGDLYVAGSPEGKDFVLYNADLPEIHALAVDQEERIYVAALGTARRGREPFFVRQETTAGSTSSSQASAPREDPGPSDPGGGSRTSGQTGGRRSGTQSLQIPAFTTPVSGRGALYRILPDNSVETLWRSNRESIFGLLAQRDRVIFSTSTQGRIFELVAPPGQAPGLTLLNETQEALATRLQEGSNGTFFVAT